MKFNEIVIKFIENKFNTVNMAGFKGTRDEFIDKFIKAEREVHSFTSEDREMLEEWLTVWEDWMDVLEDFKEYWETKYGEVPQYDCPFAGGQTNGLVFDMVIGAVECVLDTVGAFPKDGVKKEDIEDMKSDMAGFITDDNSIWWYMTNC